MQGFVRWAQGEYIGRRSLRGNQADQGHRKGVRRAIIFLLMSGACDNVLMTL